METGEQMRSLYGELSALKNRVRNIIDDRHWLTDGEWKESVLRSTLRRHLPASVGVGRGFVVRADNCSGQIDVLLYNTSKPVIYRDGDLIFVTPDAVRGIIEVKTKVESLADLDDCLPKLVRDTEFIRRHTWEADSLFIGLFAYETNMGPQHGHRILEKLKDSANDNHRRIVTHLSLGADLFARFWAHDPNRQDSVEYDRWHIYNLRNQAPGYFVNNVVASVARESVAMNSLVWFDSAGKEPRIITELPFENQAQGEQLDHP